MDVYENGKYHKVGNKGALEDAAKRICHRVDDARNEDESAFKKCRPTTDAIVNMEEIINESGDTAKAKETVRVMQLDGKNQNARWETLNSVKLGLY
jgi:hypothetical protein